MRASRFPLNTAKETPADAETMSHKLMLRAGMLRKLAAGIYTWTPLGLRVLAKVANIVREEMNRAGALEMLMPSVQPRELWEETGRWQKFGGQLLKIKDRKEQEYCYGPTHEEVVTDWARAELKSYKQLPLNVYQIQTKFRYEIRPRFGVMRAREFIMKDAYSFHTSEADLAREYQNMYDTYARIFTRFGLKFRAVKADSGAIGGSTSHEFHVLADSGEDAITFSSGSDYAANVELAEAVAPAGTRPAPSAALETVDTPSQKTIEELTAFLKVDAKQCVKTIIVRGEKGLVALCLRGDHEINEAKAAKLPELPGESVLADESEIWKAIQCKPGFIGPVHLPKDMPIIVDRAAALLADFICGANQAGKHYRGANWERDAHITRVEDLRKVKEGDPSPDGKGTLSIARGIEVGHVFQLGDKYSKAMGATVLDHQGKATALQMGCYGLGVTRVVAAAIEQNHDERGIIWPAPLTPFDIALLPLNMAKSEKLKAAAEKLYQELQAAGYDVLMDDRDLRPGPMFADVELIGIPHRLVLSDRGLDAGTVEYKGRRDADNQNIPAGELMAFLKKHAPLAAH